MQSRFFVGVFAALLSFGLSCNRQSQPTATDTDSSATDSVQWNEGDDPAKLDFTSSFIYKFDDLPIKGAADIPPWAGSYWPTFRDSINYVWDETVENSLSPTQKYATAFGKTGIEDSVSLEYGIDSMKHRTACTDDTPCNAATGEECSKRHGQENGFCIETWFGICHAWGPAAIMEPEPLHSVMYNGVEFKINDIKALITLSYDTGLKSQSLSETCEARNSHDATGIQYTPYGVPTEEFAACSDTNAGTFHAVIANMLGILHIGLVEDRTYDYEVWNQPLRGYKVWKKYPKTIDATKANTLMGAAGDKYLFNPDAVGFRHVKMSLNWITEAHQETDGNLSDVIDDYTNTDIYEYIVELDAEEKIIGGEWIRKSQEDHPDFLWAAKEKLNTEVAVPLVQILDTQEAVAADEFKSIGTSYTVGPGDKVKVTMTGTDEKDTDLYVRYKYRPTKEKFDCRPFKVGSTEECELTIPSGVTKLYIKVDGSTSGDTVTVKATKQVPGSGIEWIDVKQLLDLSIAPPVQDEPSSGFNWGSPCDGGSGSFQQAIVEGSTVEVGEIPPDKHNVRINLTSDQDVDIQLVDKESGHKIIAWAAEPADAGDLNGAGQGCAIYETIEYCYSGYDGDGTNKGHEWITVAGNTNRALTMKAFGYAAGEAKVDYSWAPLPGCIDQGSGSFTQAISKNGTVEVGMIPEGKNNIKITLTSDKDVDIQLYDGETPLVMWDDDETALLHGETKESATYKDMVITYSGYNGDGTNYGHEFITVKGKVSTALTMKAFGYAAGEAKVDYAWGVPDAELEGGQ